MTFHYPNGKKYRPHQSDRQTRTKNHQQKPYVQQTIKQKSTLSVQQNGMQKNLETTSIRTSPVKKSRLHDLQQKHLNYSNRGQTLEEEINETNTFYLTRSIAVVHKKPIPIQVVNVHYPTRSAAKITEAYYRTPSTTDYNGVWEGKYIDFEAKETRSTTSFPLQNLHEHQVQHMQDVHRQQGISFLIIRFSVLNRYFFVPFDMMIEKWERMLNGGRKSIPLSEFEMEAIELETGYMPTVDYVKGLTTYLQNKAATSESEETL